MNEALGTELRRHAVDVRKDVIRMVGVAQSGHLASSLSLVDLLVFLYWEGMKVDPANPGWEERDRFILGKRHGCPALYAVLARRGFFQREELWSYRRLGAMLQGHPEFKRTPGIDAPSGSAGLGLGIAHGITLGLRLQENPARVFCLLGDGEMKEGAIWEAAHTAAFQKSGRLVAIVDCTRTDGEMPGGTWKDPARLQERFQSFGWDVAVTDGHDFADLEKVFPPSVPAREKPLAVLALTRLGKGVPLVEKGWPRPDVSLGRHEMEQALRELNGDGKDEDHGEH